jgi:hypothetical protein|tara:strand:+ start:365 stop:604 length:240 start_codon:yes stop_codon:yes gene_type:complete
MIDQNHDELFDRVRGNLGEHFTNYMFIVMDEEGNLFYDYTNYRVGKMLVSETKQDMDADSLDIWWDDEEDIDDINGTDL